MNFASFQFSLSQLSASAFLVLAFHLFGTTVHAQGDTTGTLGQRGAITTAVPFLLICPDSRGGGMGETGVAVANNANALFWNPSILAFSPHKMGLNVNYTPWLRGLNIPDINHAFLPFYYNFGPKGGVMGASLTFFSLGDIQFSDIAGNLTGQAGAYELATSLYYTRQLTEHFSMGTGLRFIFSDLGLVSANAGQAGISFAGDINGYYNRVVKLAGRDLGLRFGFNLSNIGSKMNYNNSNQRDFIPTNLKLGYALKFGFDEYNSLTFTQDINKLLVPSEGGRSDAEAIGALFSSFGDSPDGFAGEMEEINTQLGLEYWYNDLFAARLGYFYESPNRGARQFVTVGAGVKFKMFTLDFAYLVPFTQNHPLQNTLRFSLGVNLGEVNY